jgi:citrate lyase beta subunit
MLADARSLLFVPGHRPERFAKALASGADLVCIDLEDAVPPEHRAASRAAVAEHLRADPRAGIRISPLGSRDGLRDVLALQELGAKPAFVMLAKCKSAAELRLLSEQLDGVPLIALVESVAGLRAAHEMAHACPRVQALMFGGADYSADARCTMAWDPLLMARCTLAAAAAEAGIGCIDVPFLDVADAAGAQAEAERVAALGYTGKALIHPSQVAPVHCGFAPSAGEVARAQRVVQAAARSSGAVLLEGRMIDHAVVRAAERLLRRAAA